MVPFDNSLGQVVPFSQNFNVSPPIHALQKGLFCAEVWQKKKKVRFVMFLPHEGNDTIVHHCNCSLLIFEEASLHTRERKS
jgi:hypothetical protein